MHLTVVICRSGSDWNSSCQLCRCHAARPPVRRSSTPSHVPWLVLSQGASFEVKLSVHVGGSPGLADLAFAALLCCTVESSCVS